jgi:hypothetical protein
MPPKKSIVKKPPDKVGGNFDKTPYRIIKTSLKSIIKDTEIHKQINELVITPPTVMYHK